MNPSPHTEAQASHATVGWATHPLVALASAALAAVALCAASLAVLAPGPAIVGAPAAGTEPPAQSVQLARAEAPGLQQGDRWLICFYDALSSLGGPVDGPGHQRADHACQRP